MFNKKKCSSCGKKIDKHFIYCPFCGFSDSIEKEKQLRKKEERDFDDATDKMIKEISKSFGMPILGHFPFRNIIKKLSRDIEKQFREVDREMKIQPIHFPKDAKETRKSIIQDGKKIGDIKEINFPGGRGFSISINLGGEPMEIEEMSEKQRGEKIKLPETKITEAEAKKFSKLPRQEPETKVRRLTDKIIYEIALPGVKNQKDITINKLQNSIEIKAFSKDKAYFKLIPIALPIKRYYLENETLILELKPEI